MPTISVYLDDMDIELVDRMVRMGLFPNRSQAVRMALMKYATDLKVLDSPAPGKRDGHRTGRRKRESLPLGNDVRRSG